jgi:hypothetical protein
MINSTALFKEANLYAWFTETMGSALPCIIKKGILICGIPLILEPEAIIAQNC